MTTDGSVDSLAQFEPLFGWLQTTRRVLSEYGLSDTDDETEYEILMTLHAVFSGRSSDQSIRKDQDARERRSRRIDLLEELLSEYSENTEAEMNLLTKGIELAVSDLDRPDLRDSYAPLSSMTREQVAEVSAAAQRANKRRSDAKSSLRFLLRIEQETQAASGEPPKRPNKRPETPKNEWAQHLHDLLVNRGVGTWDSCGIIAKIYSAVGIDSRAPKKIQRSLYDKLGRT